MYKDSKYKRADKLAATARITNQPKRVSAAALDKFRAVPYQLRCAEQTKGGTESEEI